MSQIDYSKLFQTCVYLCQFKEVKTIDPKIIQFAFRILYTDIPLYKQAQSNAVKYVTLYHSNECKPSKFKKATKLKKSLKKYLDTTGQDIYTCEYRISSSTSIYLAGLDDMFDGSYKTQLEELTNPKAITKTTKTSKSKEPTPEDLVEVDDEEYDVDEEVEEEEDEDEEPVTVKVKANGKQKSANV
jgi:hypothetical protein